MITNEKPDIIICGVDNDDTRVYTSLYGIKHNIPVVFTAVSRDANQGYVFVQDPGKACFGCAFPNAVKNIVTPCPNIPAVKDILKVVAGITLYAVDTLLMHRKRNWNYRMIHLAGYMPDRSSFIDQNPLCELNCSNPGSSRAKR